MIKKILIFFLWMLCFYNTSAFSEDTSVSTDKQQPIFAFTLCSIKSLPYYMLHLNNHFFHRLAARVVFDEFMPAEYYLSSLRALHKNTLIMGELLDSSAFNQYSVDQYTARAKEYINLLDPYVDIWEIGNEVNGEWLGQINDVVAKISAAYFVAKIKNVTTALTLYYNETCSPNPENTMFRWAKENIPKDLKDGLDYVFISYYPDDCKGAEPNWQNIFAKLHQIFPHAKLGFGEVGTKKNIWEKIKLMKRIYQLPIKEPNYIGGYFWWFLC